MKIMFVEPSFPETRADDHIFPFGYACLGAVLQRAGHEVKYVFPEANNLTMQDVVDHIAESAVSLIGIGGLFPYLSTIIKFVGMIKAVRPDIPVVLGGPMVTYTPELVLKKSDCDFCIAGEGEIALLKFVNYLESGKDYSNIPGLVFQRDGRVISNGLGEVMPFEDIPMPNWDDFPMEYYMCSDWYLPVWSRTRNKRIFPWLLSRGCPMKCNFCASGCKPRYKTVDQAMAELRQIVDRFDPHYLLLVDNFLTRSKKYTIEFCEALIANKFRFKFSITARVNMVDSQLLALMKKAGCQIIFYGLECANNAILRFMKKNITVEQAIKAIKMTKEAGIYPMVSIMFGQPGETLDDFLNSLRVASMTVNPKDPAPNIASVMPLLTFPGTGIYEYAKNHGYFTDDEDYWNKYSDNYRIQYTNYGYEAVQQVVNTGNILYRWKYHQSMADSLLRSLYQQRSPLRNYGKRFLKAHPRVRKMFAPLLGKMRLKAFGQMKGFVEPDEQKHIYEFLDCCLDELVEMKKLKNQKVDVQ